MGPFVVNKWLMFKFPYIDVYIKPKNAIKFKLIKNRCKIIAGYDNCLLYSFLNYLQ